MGWTSVFLVGTMSACSLREEDEIELTEEDKRLILELMTSKQSNETPNEELAIPDEDAEIGMSGQYDEVGLSKQTREAVIKKLVCEFFSIRQDAEDHTIDTHKNNNVISSSQKKDDVPNETVDANNFEINSSMENENKLSTTAPIAQANITKMKRRKIMMNRYRMHRSIKSKLKAKTSLVAKRNKSYFRRVPLVSGEISEPKESEEALSKVTRELEKARKYEIFSVNSMDPEIDLNCNLKAKHVKSNSGSISQNSKQKDGREITPVEMVGTTSTNCIKKLAENKISIKKNTVHDIAAEDSKIATQFPSYGVIEPKHYMFVEKPEATNNDVPEKSDKGSMQCTTLSRNSNGSLELKEAINSYPGTVTHSVETRAIVENDNDISKRYIQVSEITSETELSEAQAELLKELKEVCEMAGTHSLENTENIDSNNSGLKPTDELDEKMKYCCLKPEEEEEIQNIILLAETVYNEFRNKNEEISGNSNRFKKLSNENNVLLQETDLMPRQIEKKVGKSPKPVTNNPHKTKHAALTICESASEKECVDDESRKDCLEFMFDMTSDDITTKQVTHTNAKKERGREQTKNRNNKNNSKYLMPMNDEKGPFYIDRNILPTYLYQEGLMFKRWNPTQVLYEICSQCDWPPPEFTPLNYSLEKGFLYSVNVKNRTFIARERARNKKEAKHLASTKFLHFLGFKFTFTTFKSAAYELIKPSAELWKKNNMDREKCYTHADREDPRKGLRGRQFCLRESSVDLKQHTSKAGFHDESSKRNRSDSVVFGKSYSWTSPEYKARQDLQKRKHNSSEHQNVLNSPTKTVFCCEGSRPKLMKTQSPVTKNQLVMRPPYLRMDHEQQRRLSGPLHKRITVTHNFKFGTSLQKYSKKGQPRNHSQDPAFVIDPCNHDVF